MALTFEPFLCELVTPDAPDLYDPDGLSIPSHSFRFECVIELSVWQLWHEHSLCISATVSPFRYLPHSEIIHKNGLISLRLDKQLHPNLDHYIIGESDSIERTGFDSIRTYRVGFRSPVQIYSVTNAILP